MIYSVFNTAYHLAASIAKPAAYGAVLGTLLDAKIEIIYVENIDGYEWNFRYGPNNRLGILNTNIIRMAVTTATLACLWQNASTKIVVGALSASIYNRAIQIIKGTTGSLSRDVIALLVGVSAPALVEFACTV